MDPIASRLVRSPELTIDRRGENTLNPGQASKFNQLRKQVRITDTIVAGSSFLRSDVLMADWRVNGAKLHQLTQRVSALPKTSASNLICSRLVELESQYQIVGSAVDQISTSATPEQLLRLQKDMYQISENIGLLSKMVDQLTTGVKSVLQTQI